MHRVDGGRAAGVLGRQAACLVKDIGGYEVAADARRGAVKDRRMNDLGRERIGVSRRTGSGAANEHETAGGDCGGGCDTSAARSASRADDHAEHPSYGRDGEQLNPTGNNAAPLPDGCSNEVG